MAYRESAGDLGKPLADVGLSTAEKITLLAVPTPFLVIVLIAPPLFVRDALEFPAHTEAWEWGAFVAAPLAIALVLAAIVAWIVRGFDLRIAVFSSAVLVRSRGRERVYRFDEIEHLVDESYWMGKGRRVVCPSFRLEGPGVSLASASSFSSLTPSAARDSAVYAALVGAWGAYRGPQESAKLARGERCRFGAIEVERSGLHVGGRDLPWSAIAKVACRRAGWISSAIVIELREGEPIVIPAHEVPDHPALIHVCASRAATPR